MVLKKSLIKIHWFLSSQFGLDLRRFLFFLRGIPAFLGDWTRFRKDFTGRMTFVPCLHDRYEEGGTTKSEYFWQDLLVARYIFEAQPVRHVDVGSRVDGFVAHVASYREIEVFDFRPISAQIPGVIFRQADLMQTGTLFSERYCDSLSCLHALEHFGLGRYGDQIDVYGYERGITNLAKMLKPGGTFYLSTPIGQERVEFNANWVFDPRTIIRCAIANQLNLKTLLVVNGVAGPREVLLSDETLAALANVPYVLGIFVFIKPSVNHL